MAIIQTGVASGSVGGNLLVDPTFQANRVSDHPPEILGAYSLSQVSGALTTAAAGTIATPVPVFSFRWAPATTTQLCMVRRIEVGFNTTVAFTTAQSLQWNLMIARNYTVAATGGTGMTTAQVNTWKQRTVMPNSAFTGGPANIMIANTGALTTGTVTYDSQYMSTVNGGVTAVVGSSIPMQTLFQHQAGDYPLIFAVNEGFIINNGQVMGAGGSGNLIVNVEWMELAATTGNAIAY
jgi:hypothetical protein